MQKQVYIQALCKKQTANLVLLPALHGKFLPTILPNHQEEFKKSSGKLFQTLKNYSFQSRSFLFSLSSRKLKCTQSH